MNINPAFVEISTALQSSSFRAAPQSSIYDATSKKSRRIAAAVAAVSIAAVVFGGASPAEAQPATKAPAPVVKQGPSKQGPSKQSSAKSKPVKQVDSAVLYTIKPGDTLSAIAVRNNV